MTEIAHGEVGGWVAGCRDGCCREAIYAYNRKYKSDRAIYGDAARRRVDATGTRRRVQALRLMGWLGNEIAAECGWESGNAARQLLTRDTVLKDTADRVAEAYERLWRRWRRGELRDQVEHGVRRRSIVQARRLRFVPGAAWDDIDDPNELPQGLSQRKLA